MNKEYFKERHNYNDYKHWEITKEVQKELQEQAMNGVLEDESIGEEDVLEMRVDSSQCPEDYSETNTIAAKRKMLHDIQADCEKLYNELRACGLSERSVEILTKSVRIQINKDTIEYNKLIEKI